MRLKLFSTALIFSFLFFGAINIFEKRLEGFFFYEIVGENPDVFSAQIVKLPQKPTRNFQVSELEINAESVLSIYVNRRGKEKILFEKQSSEKLPIASLTKLMTALVSLDVYKPEEKLKVTEKAVEQLEERGELSSGDILSVKNLLYIMLLESSNDAAYVLIEGKDENEFMNLMNKKAKSIGMKNTYLGNSSGLDAQNNELTNFSTAEDLSKLVKHLIFNKPEILEITKTLSYEVQEENGFHHFISENTNILLKEIPGIIGGKTGYTKKAGGCMILILKAPNQGYIINIILGTDNHETRFTEMKKIIEWTNKAYLW